MDFKLYQVKKGVETSGFGFFFNKGSSKGRPRGERMSVARANRKRGILGSCD